MLQDIMDAVIEVLLLVHFIIGLQLPISLKWGLAWFASDMAPYLYSILHSIQIYRNTASHWLVQTHIVNWISNYSTWFHVQDLVHFLVAPFHYIHKPHIQIVRWYWNPKTIRDAKRGWA